MINISKYTKAQVLQALFNVSKQKGAGFFEPRGKPTMTLETAQTLVEQSLTFDYLMGRVMNVDISKDSFDPWLYDRDNGEGAAEKALKSIETVKPLGTQNAPDQITPNSDEMKPGDIVWFTEIGRYQNVYLSKSVITGQIDDEYEIKGIAGTMPAYKLFPTKEALVESFEIIDETQKISLT